MNTYLTFGGSAVYGVGNEGDQVHNRRTHLISDVVYIMDIVLHNKALGNTVLKFKSVFAS
jgi:hypothetical protein